MTAQRTVPVPTGFDSYRLSARRLEDNGSESQSVSFPLGVIIGISEGGRTSDFSLRFGMQFFQLVLAWV